MLHVFLFQYFPIVSFSHFSHRGLLFLFCCSVENVREEAALYLAGPAIFHQKPAPIPLWGTECLWAPLLYFRVKTLIPHGMLRGRLWLWIGFRWGHRVGPHDWTGSLKMNRNSRTLSLALEETTRKWASSTMQSALSSTCTGDVPSPGAEK